MDGCGRTSATSRPSTMPSPPSTGPSDARGRRSSAFVRERHAPIDARGRPALSRSAGYVLRPWHEMSHGLSNAVPPKRQMTEETIHMKAIVVTDQAAGTAGMKLMERPDPDAARLASLEGASYGDVVVEVHASGFTGNELEWPSTWIDRLGRDRTPSIPGHEVAGVVTALS